MKRILVISTAGLATGGITTHMLNYLSYIDKNVARIDVISTVLEDKKSLESFERIGCRVISMPHRIKKVFLYIKALSILLRLNQYDVAHVHGSSCTIILELFLLKLQGVKVRIAHCHNSTCSFKLIHYCFKPLMKYYYTKAFACSELAGKWMFGNKSFEILHNVFNYKKFLFSPLLRKRKRRELGLADNDIAFCVIGNLVKQKNQMFALHLFSLLDIDKSKLYVIGDGPLKSKLQEEAKGINEVKFMGIRSDVCELLQAFDFFLMPSKWEGLPVALLEAQASGIACIVSDCITSEAQLCADTQFVSLDILTSWEKAIMETSTLDKDRERRSNEAKYILDKDYNIDKEFVKLMKVYGLC